MTISKWMAIPALSLAIVACTEEEDPTPNPNGNLSISVQNLEPNAANERYEGWIIVDGSPVSTGLFEVDGNGELSQNSFSVANSDLESATDFVLTLEPYPDADPAPSHIKIIGGAFNNNTASISADHMAALGEDLLTASGEFILATPTTTDMNDELSGVWFVDPMAGAPSLTLPDLPANWAYEGWAVINGTPVSTGTFTSVSGADASGMFSGTDASGPPFPGEDFIMNAPMGLTFPTDLTGAPIVISIEPVPDNSPAPFMFKPLFGSTPNPTNVHELYPLMNQVGMNFPVGEVRR
ncbi:anti-sigma factor [Phaeocystidibacter luteus]|uniref:Anti-sigma factor n=1 Tax=Phaeocystidibacter luteus TaxID=911197 RepID=A0A6N6RIT2_9FLAO|nr:anti-sigma factor [Phaeocystidibacter luteus]KAB2805350.1 anti-sigma factor [Phaeocystidibacter luteus]